MKHSRTADRIVFALFICLACSARAADPIKVAFIDPLSGPAASLGEQEVRHFQFAIDAINHRGGVLDGRHLELVTFDGKANPQDSVLVLKQAIDQGIQYVVQGDGSSVAHALLSAINKHNQRNPTHPVLYLDYYATDPALTNEDCSFWHFRFEADADMKTND